ncbi:DUF1553 domain-containing protein [Roseiconus nitratireducens]|uniref:DUF1553 domain-containing protein n=1 Tax=Roseiconus nitratireducens TaxID=2605748 RepID=UPI001F1A1AC5|nr:DUF1553 domain-containing protein [Roseiconus nitratireducens]
MFAPADGAEAIDFNRDIRPILSDHCFQCHGPDSQTRQADLRLDTFAGATEDLGGYAALVPGDVDSSELLRRINADDEPMPPVDAKIPLSDQQKELLRSWILSGGEFDQHWSFRPLQRPRIPQVAQPTRNPIDAFVAEKLEAAGLPFSPEASPQTLIRRVTLDLTGLPPTPGEVDQFVAAYERTPELAWERLVERLIASPRYGETMALPWLDAARFADTDGYQYDGPRYQWRYRDWVIDAYNRNLPFDQFTIEQLAGDLIPGADLSQHVATAFNRNHRYNSEAGLVVEEFLLENAVDRVDTTSTLWMGLTVGCARCHDHKFDPITQQDYYSLIAFFNSVPESGRAIKSGNSEPVMLAPDARQQTRWESMRQAVSDARAALRPTSTKPAEGVLIDRGIAHHFPLDSLPESQAAARGKATFEEDALQLDGASSLELTGLKKSVTFRANQPFTVSFWIRPDDSQDGIILSRQNPGTTRPGIEVALVDGGKVRFDLITRWRAGVGRVTSEHGLPTGTWSHVTLTNDGSQSANGQKIYINGQPVVTVVDDNTNSNTGGVKPDRPLIVGAGIRPGSRSLRGALRDLRIYSVALWSDEIEVLGAPADSEIRTRFARIKPTPPYERYVDLRLQLQAYEESLPTVMVMREAEAPKPTYVRRRGVYNDLGDRVQRSVPAMLPPMDESLPRNRLGLARWLVSPEHPLTARVAVNRYWQKYFGAGLVKTPEDFGTQSEAPSHPELLDWLAVTFIESGWNIAEMQKLIVGSRTYRQQSQVTPRHRVADPQNRLLSRAPRLRLSGQAIRDQALYVSGLLCEQVGGPSVSPYQPDGLWAEMSMGMKYKPSTGADLYRRSLYTIWKRTVAPPVMSVFDAADRESCQVRREQTNTPLQALTLLNETGFVESARHLAARMLRQRDPLQYGFRSLTARQPDAEELAVLRKAWQDYRDHFESRPEQAAELIAVGQSPVCDDLPATEVAAMTSVANLLLNLDEVITRE